MNLVCDRFLPFCRLFELLVSPRHFDAFARRIDSFAILHVYGLSRVLQNARRLLFVAVGAIAITITISDVLANRAAFTSAYNWFHM